MNQYLLYLDETKRFHGQLSDPSGQTDSEPVRLPLLVHPERRRGQLCQVDSPQTPQSRSQRSVHRDRVPEMDLSPEGTGSGSRTETRDRGGAENKARGRTEALL